MEEIKQKLESEILDCQWELIEPHHLKQTVYYLKSPNDLVQVGVLVASNKAHLIKGLMDAGEIYRPSDEEVKKWSNDKNLFFKFLIIQPFVFIQTK